MRVRIRSVTARSESPRPLKLLDKLAETPLDLGENPRYGFAAGLVKFRLDWGSQRPNFPELVFQRPASPYRSDGVRDLSDCVSSSCIF